MTDEGGQQLDQKRLQLNLQDALRPLVLNSAQGPAGDAALPVLRQLLPDVLPTEGVAAKSAAKTWRLECLQSALRALCLELAADAARHSQAPLQYAAQPGAEPAMQRLLAVARLCTDEHLMDPSDLMALLIDLQDVCTTEHCLHLISWLEAQSAWLASPAFNSGATSQYIVSASNTLTRLCNTIFKRLGRHDVVNKARLLLLTAGCAPLFDRSGMNIAGQFAPTDPPLVEEVPPDAVDSAGKPVNAGLYKAFWGLQASLQDPVAVLKVADNWNNFRKGLSAVLTELARSPATVAAVRTADAAAAAQPGGAAAAADTAAAQQQQRSQHHQQQQSATQCYLSSYKLFGLQLADSSFRRGFLVQVLVMLRCLLLPGKQPADTLKPKQRMEAVELEKQVYAVLDATPEKGKDFSRAVRDVLERECTWVEWKKGGKGFVVPGSKGQTELDAAPAAAAAGGKKMAPTSCIDWSKPPAAPIAAAIEAARETAARKRKAQDDARAEGLALKAEVDAMGRRYDRSGEPYEDPRAKRNRYVKLLGGAGASALTLWAQDTYATSLAGAAPPLLAGLCVSEQPAYPLPQALCGQLLREMDPETGIEDAYKRIAEDPVYRWRVGRTVAAAGALPEGDDEDYTKPDSLERSMVGLLPEAVPAGYRERYEEQLRRRREEAEARRRATKLQQTAAAAGGGAAGAAARAKGGRPTPVPVPAPAAEDAAVAADAAVPEQQQQQQQDEAPSVKQEQPPASPAPPEAADEPAAAAAAADPEGAGDDPAAAADDVPQQQPDAAAEEEEGEAPDGGDEGEVVDEEAAAGGGGGDMEAEGGGGEE